MSTPEGRFSGIGMTSTRTRARMIGRLREQGIRDEVVLAAMNAIPRHIFVDEALAIRAYEDSPLPIGAGQTISQPWVVARMTELLRGGGKLGRVLEIGTGCGYQAAVLSQIADEVYTVERIASLAVKARRNLQSLRVKNVRLKHGDGSMALDEDLQFDGIIITAAATHLPHPLLNHLKNKGRMVLPLAQRRPDESSDGDKLSQYLTVIEKGEDGVREQVLEAVRFVPLLSGIA